MFQSLSGFFRPCNLGHEARPGLDVRVSIPVGFFQALQPTLYHHKARSLDRFNPCRVFSGLATSSAAPSRSRPSRCFNPCRVFSGLATAGSPGWPRPDRLVSIPVGFFQALQRRNHKQIFCHFPCFNPCRVFSGLATLGRPIWRGEPSVVSIPVGFFQALQLQLGAEGLVRELPFQSLSGFFRPCNNRKP